MPHIKSFTRLSTDDSKIWWFVLGSGNLSKAAWGYSQGSVYKILNYEACVVFIPKFFVRHKFFTFSSIFIHFRRSPNIRIFFSISAWQWDIPSETQRRRNNSNLPNTIWYSVNAISFFGRTFRLRIPFLIRK